MMNCIIPLRSVVHSSDVLDTGVLEKKLDDHKVHRSGSLARKGFRGLGLNSRSPQALRVFKVQIRPERSSRAVGSRVQGLGIIHPPS